MTRSRRPGPAGSSQEDGSMPRNWNDAVERIDGKEDAGPDREFAASEEEEADFDPVVKKFDVFVSNTLKDHLYLLQYPIRNWEEQYTDEWAPLGIKMKPNEGAMEFEVPIDTQNYCSEQGEKFGPQHQDFNSPQDGKTLDRQRLSGKPQQNQASYFIGRMRGGKSASSFHLLMYLETKCIFRRSERSSNFVPISITTMRLSAARRGRNSKGTRDEQSNPVLFRYH